VLGLEIHPPLDGELEFLFRFLQGLHRVAVVHAFEAAGDELLQPGDRFFFDVLRKKRHVVGAFVQDGLEDVTKIILGQIGIVVQVGERYLRLDHPELGQVPTGVRVLRPEGRPEGVDAGQGIAETLHVELARNGQKGLPPEEVLGKIDAAVRGPRRVDQIQSGNAEGLTRALGVAGGDDRGVDPVEGIFVEKTMRRLGQAIAHPGHRPEGVGPRPEVRHFAQELEAVPLGLDRIGFGDRSPNPPR